MNKYDMRICRCGKIHMIPSDKIDDAIEHNKNFMFICADCGSATVVGADKEWDEYEPDNEFFEMLHTDTMKRAFKNMGVELVFEYPFMEEFQK